MGINGNVITAKILQTSLGRELVQEGQGDLGEFKGVAPVESTDRSGIAGGVDFGVVVSSDSLIQHGGRVAILIPAGVVRAGVAAKQIVGGGQLTVGADQGLGKGIGFAVDVVSLDGDNLGSSRLETINVDDQRSLVNEARLQWRERTRRSCRVP